MLDFWEGADAQTRKLRKQLPSLHHRLSSLTVAVRVVAARERAKVVEDRPHDHAHAEAGRAAAQQTACKLVYLTRFVFWLRFTYICS